jgi:isocitrate/isopropylmalate dehydrogenase
MTPATPDTRPLRIAVIAGDGIGREVMPEGLRVLEAAARRFGLPLANSPISTGRIATTTSSTAR